jgi:hypothetical protein
MTSEIDARRRGFRGAGVAALVATLVACQPDSSTSTVASGATATASATASAVTSGQPDADGVKFGPNVWRVGEVVTMTVTESDAGSAELDYQTIRLVIRWEVLELDGSGQRAALSV